jgi:hypothetical protein
VTSPARALENTDAQQAAAVMIKIAEALVKEASVVVEAAATEAAATIIAMAARAKKATH